MCALPTRRSWASIGIQDGRLSPGGARHGAGKAARASSIRARVSSRPSAATDSKMPGEIVFPPMATRIGWKTSLGLPLALHHPAQGRLDRSESNGSSAASASARPPGFVRAVAHHLGPRLLVGGLALDQEAGERPEVVSVCIFSWVLGRRAAGRFASGSPRAAGQPSGSISRM